MEEKEFEERGETDDELAEHQKELVPSESEAVPIDQKQETIHFPWAVAIVIGVLMLCIIAFLIVILILEK